MRIPTNKYLIEVESSMADYIVTDQGNKFYKHVGLGNKEWHRQTTGIVKAVPEKFSDTPSRPTRCTYKEYGKTRMIHHGAMQKGIKEGDKVWFNYLGCTQNNRFWMDGMSGDAICYMMYADDIHAYERNGKMYANTGRCILSPIEEEEKVETTLIIPRSYKVKKSMDMAKVVAVGKPWKGFAKTGIKKGDVVVYAKEEGDWFTEDKKLLMVYHQSIHMIIRP